VLEGPPAPIEGPPAPIAIGAVMRSSAPRLVRDAVGPLATFFIGWKAIGLVWGIAMAAVFGLAVLLHERRRGRPARIVRVALVLVAIRATVGLTSGSASVYLAQEIGIDALLTAIVLGSVAVRRPLAALLAVEVYPFTPEMRASETFRSAMTVTTAAWGGYFLVRGLVRLLAFLTLGTDSYVLVIAVTDAPGLLAMLAWSVVYTSRAFRESPEWGPLMAAAPVAPIDA
jgi:hypothetical protein